MPVISHSIAMRRSIHGISHYPISCFIMDNTSNTSFVRVLFENSICVYLIMAPFGRMPLNLDKGASAGRSGMIRVREFRGTIITYVRYKGGKGCLGVG